MSVSKKHMEWAASYLAANLAREDTESPETSITVQAFADFFSEFSPRFNKMRFAEAVRTRSQRQGNPRKHKSYVYNDKDIGQWIDGAYGLEHAVNKMQGMLADVEDAGGAVGAEAGVVLSELPDDLGEDFDEQEWLDDATDLLQRATASDLTWEWDAGGLVLTQNVEREP
jgi:hypothetical protein